MSNYKTTMSDYYNKALETYRNMDSRKKVKIGLFVFAGIAAIELYYTLPR